MINLQLCSKISFSILSGPYPRWGRGKNPKNYFAPHPKKLPKHFNVMIFDFYVHNGCYKNLL